MGETKDFLSSSVPAGLVSRSQTSPMSEYLRENSPGATALSPSYAGPQRNSSTLHRLLMKKETMRPPPVAGSPDRRKTYDRMRYRYLHYKIIVVKSKFISCDSFQFSNLSIVPVGPNVGLKFDGEDVDST